jgi:hypothetical protein
MWGRLSACRPAFRRVQPAGRPAAGRIARPTLVLGLIFALLVAATALPALGAIDGTIINSTTGKPEAGVAVSLLHPGAGGMQVLGAVKSGPDGSFRIDQAVPSPPALLQAIYKGSTYNLIIPPGSPSTGLRLNVYEATSDPAANKLAMDMVILEPGADLLRVSERFELQNDTQSTFEDSAKGSLQFYLPNGADGGTSVTVQAPDGMPIQRPAEKTGKAGVFKVNYPLKPGKTGFDVRYNLMATATFSSQRARTDFPTRLVTPGGVTLSGDGVTSLGQEPQTAAHIYEVTAPSYEVKIEGTGAFRQDDSGGGAQEDTGQPKVEEVNARVYTRMYWVLGLTLGILGLGGVLLYRRGEA